MVHICWDCGCHHQRNSGSRRHLEKGGVGLCQTLTRIVSGLVGKWGHVKSQALVGNCGQLLCKELSSSGCLTPRVILAAGTQNEWLSRTVCPALLTLHAQS